MNLTEGQLFTIEALNRIEGFVWPSDAKFAAMNGYLSLKLIQFYALKPSVGEYSFSGVGVVTPDVVANDKHPDWRNSLITREQFDSVNGWVRNDGNPNGGYNPIDIKDEDGDVITNAFALDYDWSVPCKDGDTITHWRYHKPTKETEMQNPEPYKKRDCIETLIDKRKDAIEQKRIALAALEEVEAKERELMLSIQAWAESYGFDIRVLDESDEVPEVEPNKEPELVVTDWRDLQIGDVIWWSGDDDSDAGEYPVIKIEDHKYSSSLPIAVKVDDDDHSWINIDQEQWKFIRRPSK